MSRTFLEWCTIVEAKRKPYGVRLNPEDAKYGLIDRKGIQQMSQDNDYKDRRGVHPDYTQTSLDAYDAAWQNTMSTITKSLPPEMQEAIKHLREKIKGERNAEGRYKEFPRLVKLRPDAACTRCGGTGRRDDWKDWIHHGSLGKVCYRCHGSGIKTSMEPVFFRRRAIDYIKNYIGERKYRDIDKWADKVINSTEEEQPYRPVLIDVANLIKERNYRDIFNLPH